jgi:hypothetical protein
MLAVVVITFAVVATVATVVEVVVVVDATAAAAVTVAAVGCVSVCRPPPVLISQSWRSSLSFIALRGRKWSTSGES